MIAPRIETERLILRGYARADFPSYVRNWADPRVVRFIGGRPFTAEESWHRFLRNVALWEMLDYGYWAVEEKASGAFVGEAGFADFKRDMAPSIEGKPEMGWVFAPEVHGRGYATEATQAALRWADAAWGARPIVCIIDSDHAVSLRLAAKLDFVRVEDATYKGAAITLLQRG
ncbi:MAG: GNAT family N-acetyltransferase [Pseudomonadota bacterium]